MNEEAFSQEFYNENPESFIEKKLQPHLEMDEAGFQRRIYKYGEISFSFRGREELPLYETAVLSDVHVLGKLPRFISSDDQAHFESKLGKGNGEHYLVSKDLLGVINLALQLGSTDESLPLLKQELEQGIYSERALTLLDAIIAGNYIDNNKAIREKTDFQGEVLLVLALLGEQDAKKFLAEKVEALEKLSTEKKKSGEKTESETSSNVEALDPKELVCVHATKYMPQLREDGQYSIPTTSDATDNASFRNTIHFALNHKVADHGYGSWAKAGIVLISPFEEMVARNGLPQVLNTVDTYWAQNPGEPLVIPAETLMVVPGGANIQGLYERKGNRIEFKSEHIDKSELKYIIDLEKAKGDESFERFMWRLDLKLNDLFSEFNLILSAQHLEKICKLSQLRNIFFNTLQKKYLNLTTFFENLTVENGQGLQQEFENFFAEMDITSAIKGENSISDVKKKIAEHLAKGFQSVFLTFINEASVAYGIEQAGYTLKEKGQWAWGGSWEVTAQTQKLGKKLGISTAPHHATVHMDLEDNIEWAMEQALQSREGSTDFDWKKFTFSLKGSRILNLDPKTRRAIYESGYLNSRVETTGSAV